jgi:K+-sensing histidine kinase KdpD
MKELLSSLHLGILYLENLIDNLLEGASIETGKFRISPRPANLRSIIFTACSTMEPLLKKYEQPLSINLPDELPAVQVDARRVTQVVINLLSNASRYGPRNAEIKLSAQVLSGEVEVSVSDRGPGVPFEYRQDLFSGFLVARVEDGLMKKGAGLGLSVVKAIVKAHGGHVGFREHEGGGSVFWFSVPIVSAE